MNKSIPSFAKTLLAVFFIAFSAVSCSSDDEVAPFTGEEELGVLRLNFKYNNTLYVGEPITYNMTNKKIDAFYGTGANEKSITLFMPLEPTLGVHFVSPEPDDITKYGAYFRSGTNVDLLADEGLITITTITPDFIKGTFSFSGPNGGATVSVTEGDFLAER